jgi:phosphate-selective porin OprO/OprP
MSPIKTGFLHMVTKNMPSAMEVQESSNDIMFAERSLVYGLSVPYFDRAIGVNLKAMGKTWNVQGGFYGDGYERHSC